jgi:alkanesulfonate monooxygenase
MPVEIIGWIAPRISSEVLAPQGPPFNPDIIATTARIHEKADFDRVLIGYFTDAPDGFLIGAHGAAATKRLGLLLAHRPGFVSPTLAARKLATLDQLSGGRLAVHIIAGGNDADQAKDGDFVDHAGRYRRVSEYIGLLRQTWTSTTPFDHAGEFYRVSGAYSEIRCMQSPHIPIYGGGGSNHAIQALAPLVDHYMLWGEPLRETSEFIGQVCQAATAAGKSPPRFSLSTRPILAETDGEAWDRAHAILERLKARRGGVMPPRPENLGSQRLLAAAAAAEVHDTCLWMKLAEATGARGNSTALVGAPETVAMALLAYYKLGATSLLIRGYEPLEDAQEYGNVLIPLVRRLVARLDESARDGRAEPGVSTPV